MAKSLLILKLLALLGRLLGADGAQVLLKEKLTDFEYDALQEIVTAYSRN